MDIEIICECGKVLDGRMITNRWGTAFWETEPCQDCIDEHVKETQEAYEQDD